MLPIRSSNLFSFCSLVFPYIFAHNLRKARNRANGAENRPLSTAEIWRCARKAVPLHCVVKLLVKCRQTIRNTETRKIEPKTMKHSYSKSELATMAGVSYSTFYRYLKTRRSRFNQMGLSIYAKKLPLSVVKDICDDYCFDL